MTNLTQYFTAGPHGTLGIRPGSNFSYKGEYLQVFNNTEIDRWFVGAFSSATYFLTVEFDSNQKETLQVLVVARPDYASFTVYGRTSIDDQLIIIDATVNSSWLSLTASPTDPAYAGARISVFATYAETMLPLSIPTAVEPSPGGGGFPGSGGGSGGGSGITTSKFFKTVQVAGQTDIDADTVEDILVVEAGNGIILTTTSAANKLTIASDAATFKNIASPSQPTLTAATSNSTLTLTGSNGVTVTTNALSNTVNIAASSTFSSLAVSGTATIANINTTDDITVDGNLTVDGITTVDDLVISGNLTINGTSTIVNATTVEIADLNITLAKNATTPQQANGAGLTIVGANALFAWNNTFSSFTINKGLVPDLPNSLSVGSSTNPFSAIHADNLFGTISNPAQSGITSVGVLDNLTVAGNITAQSNIITQNIEVSSLIDLTSARESIVEVTSASIVAYNFTSGSIFYHITNPGVDWTVNFTNVPVTNRKSISLNIVVPQGATPYKITACQVDGNLQTIRWLGSTVPSGTANKIDIWAFTLIRRASTWIVLASLSANFG